MGILHSPNLRKLATQFSQMSRPIRVLRWCEWPAETQHFSCPIVSKFCTEHVQFENHLQWSAIDKRDFARFYIEMSFHSLRLRLLCHLVCRGGRWWSHRANSFPSSLRCPSATTVTMAPRGYIFGGLLAFTCMSSISGKFSYYPTEM